MTDCFMGLNFLFAPINMLFTIFTNMLKQIAILLVSEKIKTVALSSIARMFDYLSFDHKI